MGEQMVWFSVFGMTWTNVDLSGIAYSLPTPVLVLVLVVLAIVAVGILSRVKEILQGTATAMDYLGVIIAVVLLSMTAFVAARVVFRAVSFP